MAEDRECKEAASEVKVQDRLSYSEQHGSYDQIRYGKKKTERVRWLLLKIKLNVDNR